MHDHHHQDVVVSSRSLFPLLLLLCTQQLVQQIHTTVHLSIHIMIGSNTARRIVFCATLLPFPHRAFTKTWAARSLRRLLSPRLYSFGTCSRADTTIFHKSIMRPYSIRITCHPSCCPWHPLPWRRPVWDCCWVSSFCS